MKETSETIDKLYEKGEEKADEVIRNARSRVRGGVRQAEDMIDDLADHVSRNPVSSLLWAVAAGVAAGVGIARLSSSSSNDHPFLDRVRDGVEAGEKSWRQIRSGWGQVLSGLKAVAAETRG